MGKITVALLLAFALALAITPSMAAAKDWQTVETWGDTLKTTPEWQTVETWTTYANVIYVVGKPTLVSPDNNSTISDNTPTFNWIAGANASSQRFLLDDDVAFSSPIENVLLGGTAATYTIATPLTDDNYWWKVVAILAGLENSSDVYKFTLLSPPTEDWQTVETWGDILKSRGWENVEIWTTYVHVIEIADYPSKGADYLHTGVAAIIDDPPFEFLWKRDILGTYDEFSGPIVVGHKVWIANKGDNIFRCLGLKSGSEAWSYQLNTGTDGAPLWFDDKIYVGTGSTGSGSLASLYSFNADNGDLLWKYDGYNNSYFTSTPWVKVGYDSLLLEDFENIDDWDKTGDVELNSDWKTEGTYSVKMGAGAYMTKDFNVADIDEFTFDWTNDFTYTDDEFLVYIGDNLVFKCYWDDEWKTIGELPINTENYTGTQTLKFQVHGSTKHVWIDYLRATSRSIVYWVDGKDLNAFDADNGDLIWSEELGVGNHPFVGVYYNGITYTSGKGGSYAIAAYNAVTGNYLWGGINYTVWDSGITVDASDPDNVLLFVGCRPMRVLCVDADNGTIYWNKLIDDGGIPQNSYILTVPATWENMVYVGGKKYQGYNPAFLCLHRENGETIWTWGAGTAPAYTTLYSSPTILPSGKVIFVTNQGVVRIHDAYTGATIWTYQLTEYSYGGHVAVVEGIFLLVSDRHLWAFGSAVGYEWQIVETWGDSLEVEEEEPPPPPPSDEIVWTVFVIRFLSVFGPFGFIAWKFTQIKDPVTGARAAVWVGVGFVAFVLLWFVVDAVEAILYAI